MNYRKKANITLAGVFLFFLAAAVSEQLNPHSFGIQLLYFVSEAALVGGVADWFAVTAIFKKPLGWGFHTALIPRNRQKVIDSVASIVQTELLKMDVIRKKVEGIPFIEGLLEYIEKVGGAGYLSDTILAYLQRYLEKQDLVVVAEKLAEVVRNLIAPWNLAPKVQEISGWALKQGYLDQGLDRLAESLWDKAAEGETRQAILRYLEEIKEEKVSSGGSIFRTLMGFVEMSDGLNLDEAADALQVELLLTLRKFRDPSDPLRIILKGTILDRVANLDSDPQFAVQIESWKEAVLSDTLVNRFLENILREVRDLSSVSAIPAEPNALQRVIQAFTENFWQALQKNIELQQSINAFLVDTVCHVIQSQHDSIGHMVRETLAVYTDQDLNQFIEDKAGNDLQWIRINGSMIGGFVGLILFLCLKFVYDPILHLPALMNYIR